MSDVPLWKCPNYHESKEYDTRPISEIVDLLREALACRHPSHSLLSSAQTEHDQEDEKLSQYINDLNELQFKHYLAHCEDVRKCPKVECGYAGTVEINKDTDRIECTAPF